MRDLPHLESPLLFAVLSHILASIYQFSWQLKNKLAQIN
jgi:hypothetical protein